MSGHSKWHKIKGKKGVADAKRGNVFTKLCKAITIATQQGGGDAEMNFSLRLAVEKARAGNVPKENIERAIKRGLGESKDEAVIQEIVYEGYGPGGIAVLVETITDNTNRTVGELKNVFSKQGGTLGGAGSVKWVFARQGVARLGKEQGTKSPAKDGAGKEQDSEFELALIDAGAIDLIESEFGIEIRCKVENFQKVLETIKSFGLEPESSGLEWVAKEEIAVSEEVSQKMAGLYDTLVEMDDVKEVYTNEA